MYNKYRVSSKANRTYKGIVFDSKKEMLRYVDLLYLEGKGIISGLQLQVKFELQPAFIFEGKKIQAINHVCDFQYMQDGKLIVEDVKGMKTPVYEVKKKMLLYKYRDINFMES